MADQTVRLVWQFESKCQHAEIRCRCGRTIILAPALAIEMLGAMTELRVVEKRLRCEQCGKRQATIRGIYRDNH